MLFRCSDWLGSAIEFFYKHGQHDEHGCCNKGYCLPAGQLNCWQTMFNSMLVAKAPQQINASRCKKKAQRQARNARCGLSKSWKCCGERGEPFWREARACKDNKNETKQQSGPNRHWEVCFGYFFSHPVAQRGYSAADLATRSADRHGWNTLLGVTAPTRSGWRVLALQFPRVRSAVSACYRTRRAKH